MSKSRRFTGFQAEEWFRTFTKETNILSKIDCPVELLVRILNRELPKRLDNARAYIYLELPQGNEWIKEILNGKIPPELMDLDRQRLSDYLLDKVIGTDSVVDIQDHMNIFKKIAVDVTVDPAEEEEKLAKIQGRPEKKDRQSSDRNVNIPVVRNVLGIDKHLIVVLNRDKNRLPSYEYLLSQLQNAVNKQAKTQSLNLSVVPENERFNWNQPGLLSSRQMWDKFILGIPPQAKHEISVEATARAIQAGFDHSSVCQMLTHDPQYRQFARQDEQKAEEYAQRIYELAIKKIDLENRRSLTPQSKHQIQHTPAQQQAEGRTKDENQEQITSSEVKPNYSIEKGNEIDLER